MPVRREEVQVGLHTHQAHFQEHLLRRICHRKPLRAALQTSGILVRAEKANLAVFAAECLKPLEAGVAIMENSRKGVEMEIKITGKFRLGPLSVAIAAIDDGARKMSRWLWP